MVKMKRIYITEKAASIFNWCCAPGSLVDASIEHVAYELMDVEMMKSVYDIWLKWEYESVWILERSFTREESVEKRYGTNNSNGRDRKHL